LSEHDLNLGLLHRFHLLQTAGIENQKWHMEIIARIVK